MTTDPPPLEIRDYHKELLVDLLNRRPDHSVHEFPEWYDDANPEAYLELVDLGLITGIEYEEDEDGGMTVHVAAFVSLTDEGRRIAEATRRSLEVNPSRVFVSYIRDDSADVDRLCSDLESAGVRTWRDVDQLLPGDDWKIVIRRAIEAGTGFIACFSQRSEDRSRSYMREELTLAIEQLRQRPTDSGWFIPVLLDDVDMPDTPIGGGRTLRDLQFIRWYESPPQGFEKLLAAIDRLQH
jgi:TIR domain